MKYTIPTEGLQDYGSHLPVLNQVLEKAKHGINGFEFGCGMFSTLTFLNSEKVNFIFCLEMQDAEWIEKINKIVKRDRIQDRFWFITELDPEIALGYAKSALHSRYNIAFVDGHISNRPECVNACFDAEIPVIIAHDYQSDAYGWERIKQPDNYTKEVYTSESGIETVVFEKID